MGGARPHERSRQGRSNTGARDALLCGRGFTFLHHFFRLLSFFWQMIICFPRRTLKFKRNSSHYSLNCFYAGIISDLVGLKHLALHRRHSQSAGHFSSQPTSWSKNEVSLGPIPVYFGFVDDHWNAGPSRMYKLENIVRSVWLPVLHLICSPSGYTVTPCARVSLCSTSHVRVARTGSPWPAGSLAACPPPPASGPLK